MSNLYALDGVCHNAEPGTYGHECGKPATWIGTGVSGFQSGYCDDCNVNGWEGKAMSQWRPVSGLWRVEQWRDGGCFRGWQVVRDQENGRRSYAATFATSVGPVAGYRHRIAAQTLAVDLNRREQRT